MSIRSKLTCAGIGTAMLLLFWLALTPGEPEYLGHRLSFWIKPWEYSKQESPQSVEAAYLAMNERAVKWLANHLTWESPVLWHLTARTLNHFGDFMADEDTSGDLRPQAAQALMRLGPRARPAIPSLEAAVARPIGNGRDLNARTMALAALIQIRGDRPESYLEQIKTSGLDETDSLVQALGFQGSNAAVAVPVLINLLTNQPPRCAYSSIFFALSEIRTQPDRSVPAVAAFLNHPICEIRQAAIIALGRFGPDARPVWSELAAHLSDTNDYTRYLTSNSLKNIDLRAAERLGIH